MLKRKSLHARMLITICSVALLAFVVTIAFVTIKARTIVKNEAIGKTREMARHYSGAVKAEVEVAMDTARSLAQTFAGIKESGNVPQRAVFDKILERVLTDNPGFLGVWTCWEPDALDGKDAEYSNAPGHDSSGRYTPYWYRSSGKIAVEPLADYDKEGAGDYYLLSQRSGDETILNPYVYPVDGKEVLLTSLVAPIKYNGRVVGVTGVDIILKAFEAMVSEIKPFETGWGFLIANDGGLVAYPPDPNLVGQNLRLFGDVDAILSTIGKGAEILDTRVIGGQEIVTPFVPVKIGLTKTPWSFAISIPMDKVLEKADRLMFSTIFIGVVSLLALIGVVFFIARGISRPLHRIAANIGEGARQVASASTQISSASQSLAEGSSEQAASIEETSASLEEMSSMTKQNADNARQADSLMKETNRVVQKSNGSMIELTTSMEEISKASEETSKIIKTIDEIAFQTNLLALNAAVEAARAGEAGAGFAVVADEVRNLAMRAADAAKNTADLIEGTVKKVKDGGDLVTRTNENFTTVAESAARVGELVGEIAAASSEQAQGIDQVNTAVTEMDKVTQQNAASAEESASASEEMNAQAEQMNAMVGDLVILVNGSSESNTGFKGQPAALTHRAVETADWTRQQAKTGHPKTGMPTKATDAEVDPNQLIPFDDSDLKDF